MKKALILLSAILLIAVMAIPAFAEFDLEDFTLPESGVHFGFNGDAKADGDILTGELVGDPTFVEGRDGTANGAVYLDDNEQYIFLGKYVDAENYTANFWCKVEDNTEHVFLCSSILGSIRIIHDGGVVVGNTINGVVDNKSDYAAPRNEWVMMTFVYTGADEKMDIYANGELVGSLSGALPLPFTLLGNEATEQKGWQSYPFLTLDDAWFYPRAFTADEVKATYAETGGTASASGSAGAVEPTILWDFNEDEAISANMGANSGMGGMSCWGEKDDAGNDYYVFVASSNDPNVSVDIPADDVSDVLWAKARVKNSGPATAIELFGHTNGRGLTGSECTHIDVATDGQWHTYIIYIPDENVRTVNAYKDPQYAITEPYWEGTVEWIRLDPMWQEGDDGSDSGGSMSSGDEIAIDYIAFFPTKEAAEAFRADQDSAGTPAVGGASAEINDGAVEVRGEYRFYTEQPEIKGELIVDVNSDLDEISGYNGEIGGNLHNLASGGNGYCCKMDSCVWYDFEAPADGTYLFMIEYVAREGAERGTDWALDDPEGQNRHYIDLWECMDHTYVVSTFETTKGKHSFYVYAPSGMDDSSLKSCDTYWVYIYYIPDGLAAALPTVAAAEAPAAPAGYPASGESGNFMMGRIIGNETGWDGTAGSGAASAFDGKPETFFDPLGVGDGFCGMEFDEPYILEKVAILSRSTFLDRFAGASIEGSNDGEEWETLWESDDVAPSATEYNIVTEFENNYGYKMFRYINWINHGDVAEVEFYGKPGTAERPAEEPKAEEPAKTEEPAPAEEPKTEEPAPAEEPKTEEPAPTTPETPASTETPTETKSGCGSFIGGGLIVLAAILGSARISKRR